jgi:lysophospholipase L1-like esterase
MTLAVIGEATPRLAELPLRLAESKAVETGLFMTDDAAGYVMQAHFKGRVAGLDFDQKFETNGQGLRGAEVQPKQAGEFRVVVLGDSIAFGGQVPENQRLTERLEALLRSRTLKQVRVINVAVPGWSKFNEAGYLEANWTWLQPDLVVLAVYLGNDLEENVLATAGGYQPTDQGAGVAWGPHGQVVLRASTERYAHNFDTGVLEYAPQRLDPYEWHEGDPLPQPVGNTVQSIAGAANALVVAANAYVPSSRVDAMRTWLHSHSRIYQAASDGAFYLRHGYGPPRPLTLNDWLTFALRHLPNWYWIQLGYPLTAHYLDRARATAAAAGAPFLAVLIPHEDQFVEEKRAASLGHFHLLEDEVDMDRPQRELTVLAQQAEVELIDLTPALRARSDRGTLTYPHDIHLTPRGHAAVAQALANALEQSALLPLG